MKRIQMLHDLANDDGYVALRRAAEDREGSRHRERMPKSCSTAKDYRTVDAVRVRRYRNSTAGMAPNVDGPDSVCQAGWVSMSPAVEQAEFDCCWSNGTSTHTCGDPPEKVGASHPASCFQGLSRSSKVTRIDRVRLPISDL